VQLLIERRVLIAGEAGVSAGNVPWLTRSVRGLTRCWPWRSASQRGNFRRDLRVQAPAAAFRHINDLHVLTCGGCGCRGGGLPSV